MARIFVGSKENRTEGGSIRLLNLIFVTGYVRPCLFPSTLFICMYVCVGVLVLTHAMEANIVIEKTWEIKESFSLLYLCCMYLELSGFTSNLPFFISVV